MNVARELVTRLSFAFDRTNLDKFEKAISNFKTKFDIGRLAIESTFGKIVKYSKEFSDNILKNNAIAKFTKTSLTDLTALQNAFQKFDVEPEFLTPFLENLSIQIGEASRGVSNEFYKLVQQSYGTVRLRVNGEVVTIKQALSDIIKHVKKFENESEQLRIIQNIFQSDLKTAESIQQLFKLTEDEFQKLIEKEKISEQTLYKNVDAAREFK